MAIGTIFVALMENRSFDHLLGYRAFDDPEVEGLSTEPAWIERATNSFGGTLYPPFRLRDPYHRIDADPPHGRGAIETQMGPRTGDEFAMKGFVESYTHAKPPPQVSSTHPPPVMGYFTAAEAPITDFLARNFAICDHWHAPLPAGTQPNRLMAMSGFATFDTNKVPMPHQELVYDWLNLHGIRWRVYHSGIPFFALMLDRIDDILSGRFRPIEHFRDDVFREPPDEFPQVVFLEPVYSDAPHTGPATDDHSPAGIKGGQEFLLEAYRGVTRSRGLWEQSVMIVTYDEHGGFFDHVSPPLIRTEPPAGAGYKAFESLGVRVPALVVSPFVSPGHVHHGVMDHTSILKFIGQTFGKGHGYSPLVDDRPVGSVGDVLDNPGGDRDAPVVPSLDAYLAREPQPAGRTPGTEPETPIQDNFREALNAIRDHPVRPAGVYDQLLASFPNG
jgi:phospholipase C